MDWCNDIIRLFRSLEGWDSIPAAIFCCPALTPLSPERSFLKHLTKLQWRSCWKDALTLLIQPSVGAQFSIHSCHILILSLEAASGNTVKELTVWGVKRDWDWYTEYIYRYALKHWDTFLQKHIIYQYTLIYDGIWLLIVILILIIMPFFLIL